MRLSGRIGIAPSGVKRRLAVEPQTPAWAPDAIEGQSGDFVAVVYQGNLWLVDSGNSQAYQVTGANRYFDGTFDPSGNWHSMYYLTTALIYNSAAVKAESPIRGQLMFLLIGWNKP